MTKILIVEDDPLFCELLARRLGTEFEIVTASCGLTFLQKALAEKPDLIVLDIMLGDSQGPQVLDELCGKDFNPLTPVLFLSTLVDDKSVPRIPPGRRTALLSKSIPIAEIHQIVRQLLAA